MKQIISVNNPEVKQLVKLQDPQERRTEKKFIVEGHRAIETIAQKLKINNLYTIENNCQKAKELAPEDKITIVSDNVMQKISTATTSSGYLAVFDIPDNPDKSKLTAGLVLAQINNPGNMGTLIRTAAACNIKSVVVIEGCDPWSPKTVQSSVGTIANLNIFQWDWQTLIKNKNNLKLCGLVVENGKDIKTIESKQALLVIGNEAHGLPAEWQESCDDLISLEMPGNIESLNASVAGSIALYLTFVSK